jgi:hypothetical protein
VRGKEDPPMSFRLGLFISGLVSFSGCAFRRHALSIPGIGTLERLEVTPWGQTQPITRYAFALDTAWPVSLVLVAVVAASVFYLWRRKHRATAPKTNLPIVTIRY